MRFQDYARTIVDRFPWAVGIPVVVVDDDDDTLFGLRLHATIRTQPKRIYIRERFAKVDFFAQGLLAHECHHFLQESGDGD